MPSYNNIDTDVLRELSTNLKSKAETVGEAINEMNSYIEANIADMNAANIQKIVTQWEELKTNFDSFVAEMDENLPSNASQLSDAIDEALGGVG